MNKTTQNAKSEREFSINLDIKGNIIQQLKNKNYPKPGKKINFDQIIKDVNKSWGNSFTFLEDDETRTKGLRRPQIGSLHAILSHWTVSNEPATIVMPTGTGKTETILSTVVINQCEKVLIIVPTDALRTQISTKFLSLGVLKKVKVLSEEALLPVVGILKHNLKTSKDIDDFFGKCNIIVTTMQITSQSSTAVQERMAFWCPYLIIDEAHHIAADAWGNIKNRFKKNRILQFTATPFRNDDKNIGGKIIFNYPLSKALSDEYFRKIDFAPIREYNLKISDETIAQKAINQLRKDLKRYNHILMARVANKKRAEEIFEIYKKYKEFNPIQLHVGLPEALQKTNREKLLNGESKIVICINMLGEGFDLPELKIAAFHDIKKSLPATLQLAGRFTRTRHDVGNPTFIANIADISVKEEIQKLYTQDSDWNALLPQSSETIVQKKIDFFEFLDGFKQLPEDFPLQAIKPALSTVIYKSNMATWNPKRFREGIDSISNVDPIYFDINKDNNILIIIGARRTPIDWAQVKEVSNLNWELFVLFWDEHNQLLFINSSTNNGYFKRLAEAVAGNVELLNEENIFRCFHGVNRLKLQNVGLIKQLGKLISYTMNAGSDIEAGLTQIQIKSSRRANIFGVGYENGRKITIGCSYKGRVWARSTGNLEELINWCKTVGSKILDKNIDPNKVLEGALKSVQISVRPAKTPTHIDWPDEIYQYPEHQVEFNVDNKFVFDLLNTDINIINTKKNGDLTFEITSQETRVEFQLNLTTKNEVKSYAFKVINGKTVTIKTRSGISRIEDYFFNNRPIIYFNDGSSLEGNLYTELAKNEKPYIANKIIVWDWSGIDIKKESQGLNKDTESIQFRVIQKLKKQGYSLIFNDDNPGEAADVVAIKNTDKNIYIEFYHCKYSGGTQPGARVSDLYEVCGQAQKSTRWMEKIYSKPKELFSHLLRREAKRIREGQTSRIEKGSIEILETLETQSSDCPVSLKIFIVQPGVAKTQITTSQLDILGATESYLQQTYGLEFEVIASE